MGVSGGEEGALHGPSLMPGGSREAWQALAPILSAIAAKAEDGEPCVAHIGPRGAGHYVKMVHNGIEYGDMQLIAEVYDLLHRGAGLSAAELASLFDEWNRGELRSYLVEITARILAVADPDTGRPLVDVILDEAQQKGTGKWASQSALDIGAPIPTINAAVEARILSALKAERAAASRVLRGPSPAFGGDRARLVDAARQALHASKITSYAQGLACCASPPRSTATRSSRGRSPASGAPGASSARACSATSATRTGAIPRSSTCCSTTPSAAAVDERQQAWRFVVQTAVGPRHPGARARGVARLLRRVPQRAAARQPDPGPARLLRRPHLPAHRPRGLVPHGVAGRQVTGIQNGETP